MEVTAQTPDLQEETTCGCSLWKRRGKGLGHKLGARVSTQMLPRYLTAPEDQHFSSSLLSTSHPWCHQERAGTLERSPELSACFFTTVLPRDLHLKVQPGLEREEHWESLVRQIPTCWPGCRALITEQCLFRRSLASHATGRQGIMWPTLKSRTLAGSYQQLSLQVWAQSFIFPVPCFLFCRMWS